MQAWQGKACNVIHVCKCIGQLHVAAGLAGSKTGMHAHTSTHSHVQQGHTCTRAHMHAHVHKGTPTHAHQPTCIDGHDVMYLWGASWCCWLAWMMVMMMAIYYVLFYILLYALYDCAHQPTCIVGHDVHVLVEGIMAPHLPLVGVDDGDDGLQLPSAFQHRLSMAPTPAQDSLKDNASNYSACTLKISIAVQHLGITPTHAQDSFKNNALVQPVHRKYLLLSSTSTKHPHLHKKA